MVCNIKELKNKKSGKLIIKNKSKEALHIIIENNNFAIRTSNSVTLISLRFKNYKSIKQFINDVKLKCSLVDLDYSGDIEEEKNITSVNKKLLPNRKEETEVVSRVYQNCQGVIWDGDIILTDKYKLYQVNNVNPTDAMINEYVLKYEKLKKSNENSLSRNLTCLQKKKYKYFKGDLKLMIY